MLIIKWVTQNITKLYKLTYLYMYIRIVHFSSQQVYKYYNTHSLMLPRRIHQTYYDRETCRTYIQKRSHMRDFFISRRRRNQNKLKKILLSKKKNKTHLCPSHNLARLLDCGRRWKACAWLTTTAMHQMFLKHWMYTKTIRTETLKKWRKKTYRISINVKREVI